jgi:hypothetical protein
MSILTSDCAVVTHLKLLAYRLVCYRGTTMLIVKFLPIFLAIFAAQAASVPLEDNSGECTIIGSPSIV